MALLRQVKASWAGGRGAGQDGARWGMAGQSKAVEDLIKHPKSLNVNQNNRTRGGGGERKLG